MITYFLILVSLILVAFAYLKIADHFNIIDKPNQRSSHIEPTIRGGGIIFYVAIVIFFFVTNFEYPYFFFAVTLIAFVSFIDDLITLGRRIRLLIHFITAFLLLVQLGLLGLPIWAIVLCLIFVVAFFNLYNFMDGINGLTGMYSFVVLIGFLLINYSEELVNTSLLIDVMLAILVFGYLNFRKKAKWFAGDIGSMTMATLILFLGGLFMLSLNAPVILLLVVVYAIDGGLTILFRVFRKENITEAHRHHLYQKFVDVEKWSHLKVSCIYALIQLFISFLVYYFYTYSFIFQTVLVVAVVVLFSMLYYFLKVKYEKIEERMKLSK